MEKEWTTQEVHDFLEWDLKRRNGELGAPLHFKSSKEAFEWLKN